MGRVEQGRQRLLEIVTKLRAWEYIVEQGDAFAILFSAYKGSREASFFDVIVQEKTNKKRQKVDTCHDFCNALAMALAIIEEQKSTLSSTSFRVIWTFL